MPENIVYVLGAGFSAPLGIPVMANFISYSKDLYFKERDRYSWFAGVFGNFRQLSHCKNYFYADLMNIEEVLSILEIGSQLGSRQDSKEVKQFIRDVVSYYTPHIRSRRKSLPANWTDFTLNDDQENGPCGLYCLLYGNMLGIKISGVRDQVGNLTGLKLTANGSTDKNYSFVSMNYDQVIEHCCSALKKEYVDTDFAPLPLYKLHGCVSSDVIPPTWSKLVSETVRERWQKAFALIRDANHIRIVGYSLPDTDAYVRYLLKAAVQDSEHLKSIDVICLDPAGNARKRYDEFITFINYRFISKDFLLFLKSLRKACVPENGFHDKIVCDQLERVHNDFMCQSP